MRPARRDHDDTEPPDAAPSTTMQLLELTRLLTASSVVLLALALGLRATFADAISLLRRWSRPPYQLARALLAMYVLVPLIAGVLTAALELAPPVEIAMLAVAMSPVPPVLPGKQLRFGGRAGYVIGLWVAVSITAIAMMPLAVHLLGLLFQREARIGVAEIARPIGLTILLPLVVGLGVHRLAPARMERLAPWVARLGNGVLLCAVVPILLAAWPAMVSLVGNGTVLTLAAMALAAMAAGHALGGPDPDDRTALAIASTMRHPGVALAIVRGSFPADPQVPAAILLYLLLGTLATTLYGARRRDAALAA